MESTALATVEAVKAGYKPETFVERWRKVDAHAVDNSKRAMWKVLFAWAQLMLAAGKTKGLISSALYGDRKPPSTFETTFGMAKESRNALLGNATWMEVRAMTADEAETFILEKLDVAMTVFGANNRDEYAKVCHLGPNEAEQGAAIIAAHRQGIADKAQAKADKGKPKAETAKAEEAKPEAAAPTPQATVSRVEKAMDAMNGAEPGERLLLIAQMCNLLDADQLQMVADGVAAMLANVQIVPAAKAA